ncbi:MAG: phosphoribosylanthranilate isomerase [Planctomycetota bacterium]|nr:phosphoribosylanthranilate isomerase [Planctomycetota bacterium]
MVQVKICGVTRAEDARAAALAGANAIGINFVAASPRSIGGLQHARALVQQSRLGRRVRWAGVFVNPTVDEALGAVAALGLRIVQLHGEETPAFVRQLKRRLGARVAVWKAFRVATEGDLEALQQYDCDAWLVDAKCRAVRGGSGRTFDWAILKALKRTTSLVLAGGLNPGNVREAVRRVRPDWVDTASGVESAPGVKDAALIERFIRAARGQKAPGK